MRKILFRGKRKDTGEWVEGFYFKDGNNNHYIYCPLSDGTGREFWNNKFCFYVIDPTTLGQFSNKLDDKGQKVFEGDIDSKGYICMFYNNAFQMCLVVEGEITQAIPMWSINKMGEFVIIGNIHDKEERE